MPPCTCASEYFRWFARPHMAPSPDAVIGLMFHLTRFGPSFAFDMKSYPGPIVIVHCVPQASLVVNVPLFSRRS